MMDNQSGLVLHYLLFIIVVGITKSASQTYTTLPVPDVGNKGTIPNANFKSQGGHFSFGDEDSDAYEKLRTLDNSIFSNEKGVDADDNPFRGKRIYNTSIALTASFFSFYLPVRTGGSAVTELVNQSIYGLFGTLAVVLIYGVPILFTGIRDNTMRSAGRNNDEEEESSWISSPFMHIDQVKRVFDEKLRDEIGLDSTKCLQKTICEAHRAPKNEKYGLLVLPFQMFFPPPANGTSTARATSYQIAAQDGKFSKNDCAKKYKCFFDTLDFGSFLIDWYRLSNDPEYVPKDSDFY